MPNTTPTFTTVDEALRFHADRIEGVYNRRTAGDSTFLGLLVQFLMDVRPALDLAAPGGRETDVEPLPGSVVLIHGNTGTSYQRLFSDEKWHSPTGQVREWADVVKAAAPRLPVVIHDVTEADLA